jgi:hypothetical protein
MMLKILTNFADFPAPWNVYKVACPLTEVIQRETMFISADLDCVRKVMAYAQKPDFVFPRNGRVHLNRRGRQFSRLLAAEVSASALVTLDSPRSEVVWEYLLPTPFASFPFTSPPVRHRVPSGFKRTLQHWRLEFFRASIQSHRFVCFGGESPH